MLGRGRTRTIVIIKEYWNGTDDGALNGDDGEQWKGGVQGLGRLEWSAWWFRARRSTTKESTSKLSTCREQVEKKLGAGCGSWMLCRGHLLVRRQVATCFSCEIPSILFIHCTRRQGMIRNELRLHSCATIAAWCTPHLMRSDRRYGVISS